jgi:hypothetical protein
MKKIFVYTTSMFILLLLLILPLTGCSRQDKDSQTGSNRESSSSKAIDSQEPAAGEATPYPVPAEKAQMWESLKNVALKDYEVCIEHCGTEQSCLDRCESVYKHRLENDYKRVIQQGTEVK